MRLLRSVAPPCAQAPLITPADAPDVRPLLTSSATVARSPPSSVVKVLRRDLWPYRLVTFGSVARADEKPNVENLGPRTCNRGYRCGE